MSLVPTWPAERYHQWSWGVANTHNCLIAAMDNLATAVEQNPVSITQAGLLPLASLTFTATKSTAAYKSTSKSARAVQGVPALRLSNAHRQGCNRDASRSRLLVAPRSSSNGSGQLPKRQQQRSNRVRPWKLPLAAAALAFHVARSAARVSGRQAMGQPGFQHIQLTIPCSF
jgi:hypothetical protein